MSQELPKEAISISAQFGGTDVGEALKPHFFALKRAFRPAGPSLPCEKITQMAFILRGDGAVHQFQFEGCENIEVNLRSRYISIDVGVPIHRWSGRSALEIAAYLVDSMRQGLSLMLVQLEERKFKCSREQITSMFEEGAGRYLELVKTWLDGWIAL